MHPKTEALPPPYGHIPGQRSKVKGQSEGVLGQRSNLGVDGVDGEVARDQKGDKLRSNAKTRQRSNVAEERSKVKGQRSKVRRRIRRQRSKDRAHRSNSVRGHKVKDQKVKGQRKEVKTETRDLRPLQARV
eukprot:3343816-Rhodomonas_salina.1